MTTHDKAISSLQNPVVKKLRALSSKKYRDEDGIFMVEGARHVNDALDNDWQPDVIAYSIRAVHDDAAKKALATARAARVMVLEVTDDILSSITGRDNNQPILATFKQRRPDIAMVKDGLWLALEGIRDPGNLGTIIRTADAAGANGVMLIGSTCDFFAPETIRATMGSFARMPVVAATEQAFTAWRKTYAGKVIGTHLHANSIDYRDTPAKLPLLLLMGSESNGLSPALTAACDTLVKIPMAGGTESLNLAVSTGIMLYEIARGTLPK
ncbi:MAG: RNA methyltransferase [Micavibrio sp.]|nr:RNA methyltransferase [Micavibrio sp.]